MPFAISKTQGVKGLLPGLQGCIIWVRGCISVRGCIGRYSLWRWGVTFHVLDVSHEAPDVTPSRASPPMPVFRTCLARNAWCNTMSHLTAAGCTWVPPGSVGACWCAGLVQAWLQDVSGGPRHRGYHRWKRNPDPNRRNLVNWCLCL